MAKKSTKKFRVRNRFHQIVGEFGEKELLSRIRKGKFQGDEEVCELPDGSWKKMPEITRFFEAFLKRLGDDGQESEEGSSAQASAASSKQATPEKGKEQGKTEHLGEIQDLLLEDPQAPEGSVLGGTLRKSDVDRLFEEEKRKEREEEPLLKVPLDEMENSPRQNFAPLGAPLNPRKLKELTDRMRQVSAKRRRLALVALLVVLLTLLFQSGQEEGQKTAEIEAAPLFNESVLTENERRQNASALLDEARVFYSYDSGIDYRAAADISKEGIRLIEKNIELLTIRSLSLARIMQEAGNDSLHETLVEVIKKGREIEPHHAAFYRAEAIEALATGKVEEAKTFAQEAIEADPTDSESMGVVAEVALAIGDLSLAESQLGNALRVNPTSVRLQHLAGVTAFRKKNYEAARRFSGEAAKLNPLHSDSYAIVGDIQSEKSDLKNAKVLYELTTRLGKFASRSVLARSHERLAKYYEITGSPTDQAKHLKASEVYADPKGNLEAVEDFYYDRTYFEERGAELLKERKNDQALRFFQALRVLYPRNATLMVKAGEVMERLATTYDDFRKVMLLYERAAQLDKKNPNALIHLAALEIGQYNFSRALELLTQAELLAPDNAEVKVAFGKFYYRRQDFVRARDYLSKASVLNPTNAEVQYYYGMLTRLYRPDQTKEAARHFYQAYTLDMNNYNALAEWLKIRVENHEKNFAIKFILNLLETDKNNAELYWVFGEVYTANKETRRAITYYHKALDIDNRASRVRMSLGRALASVGEIPSAVEEFVLASKLDRRSPEGFFEAGQLLFDMKKPEFAEDVLKKLVEVTPNFPGAHRLLARVYQSKNKKDDAIGSMKREVENNPYNYKFAVEFAELYMVYEEYDKAIEELKRVTGLPSETKAPEFRTDRVRAYLLLSRCLRAQNKSESAEGAIKSAIQIDPTDPELKRELGYVYYALQRDKEATDAFNYYLERNPAAQDSALIKTLIKKMGSEDY